MAWAELLVSLARPIVTRVLVALGFGYVSYQGAQGVLIAALQNVGSSFGGLAAEAVAILARSGFFLALSILSGGIIGGVAYMLTTRLTTEHGPGQTTGT